MANEEPDRVPESGPDAAPEPDRTPEADRRARGADP